MAASSDSLINGTVGNVAKRVVAVARWLFGPAAVLFLAVAGWHSRAVFVAVVEQAAPTLLLVTVILWALLHLLTPVFSWVVLREMGADIGYRTLLAIHVSRLPARYLPGGIWHTVSRVMDLHRLGVARSQLSVMVLLENAVPVAIALILGGVCFCLNGNATWLAFAVIAGGLLVFGSSFRLLRHRSLRQTRTFALGSYWRLASVTCLFWIVAATAFYCYWSAFPGARESIPALQLYGVYLLAWVAGFVSVFAPQGIGVFESVAGLFLQGALTFAGAAVLAAGFRVAILGADLLAFGILIALRFFRSWQNTPTH